MAEDVPPVLSEPGLFLELEEVHHPLLKSVVEDLQATVSKRLEQDPTGAAALRTFLEQPFVNKAKTWRKVFAASPPRGVVRCACRAVGAELDDSMGYHGFAELIDFTKAVKELRAW